METHRREGKVCTLAAARPSGRNVILPVSPEGELTMESVREGTDAWTGASIYAFSPRIFHYLQGSYELDYFVRGILAEQKQVALYRHPGFWLPVETYRDLVAMENMWNAGVAPWKKWQDFAKSCLWHCLEKSSHVYVSLKFCPLAAKKPSKSKR